MGFRRSAPSANVVWDWLIGDGTGVKEVGFSTVLAGVTTKRFRFLETGVFVASLGITVSSFATAGVVHNSASGVFSSSLLVNADITVGTINVDKISSSGTTAPGQVPTWNGTAVVWAAGGGATPGNVTNVAAGLAPVITATDTVLQSVNGTSALWAKVTGAQIAAGTITPANVSSTGAPAGGVITFNGSNVVWATPATPPGFGGADDVYLTNGVPNAAVWSKLSNLNVSATAAIAGTKISPDFGAQNVTTTGVYTGGPGTRATTGIFNTPTNVTMLAARGASSDLPAVQKLVIDELRFGGLGVLVSHYAAGKHLFESAANAPWWTIGAGTFTVDAGFAAPVITQFQAVSGGGSNFSIRGQAAASGSGANGGSVIVRGGDPDGGGVLGGVSLQGSTVISAAANGHIFLNQAGTVLQWTIKDQFVLAGASMAQAVFTQSDSTSGAGRPMIFLAQAAQPGGGNLAGGDMSLGTGAGAGTGLAGNFAITGNRVTSRTREGTLFTDASGVLQFSLSSVASPGYFLFGPTLTSLGITQTQNTSGNGAELNFVAQSGGSGGGGGVGGDVFISGGSGTGGHLAGRAFIAGQRVSTLSVDGLYVASSSGLTNHWTLTADPGGAFVQLLAGASYASVQIGQAQSIGGSPSSIIFVGQQAATGSGLAGGGVVFAGGVGDGGGGFGTASVFGSVIDIQSSQRVRLTGPFTGNETANDTLRFGRRGHSISTGTTTLSALEMSVFSIEFVGVLTGDVTVIMQLADGWTKVINMQGVTFGSHTVTFKGPTGAGVIIGGTTPSLLSKYIIICDGTDIH